jgi:hypothetical protein
VCLTYQHTSEPYNDYVSDSPLHDKRTAE